MGMFDDVICEAPLPDGYEGRFQSKDFDCELATYKITADGRLLRREYEWKNSPDAPLGIRRVERGWTEVLFHGVLNFYDYADDKSWREYNAKFTDGRLVEITKVPERVASSGGAA